MSQSLLFCLDNRKELSNDIVVETNKITHNWTMGNFKLENNLVLGTLNKQKFSDGEVCVDFFESVRGKRVYILSSPNNSDEIMKLMLAIDAAKRAAATEIIPILPYFPYARQDKKDQSRGPIGAKVMAEMIEQRGSTAVITFDLHADQIQGFFDIPVNHIEGKNVFDTYIASICGPNTILAGPDAGSGKRVKRMKDQLAKRHNINLNYVMMDKTRKEANVVDEMVIIGDVSGKDVIIIDDMVDTAGTLVKAADVIMESGANSVKAVISHGILSGPALSRIGQSKLESLIISDSLDLPSIINNEDVKGRAKIIRVSTSIQIALAVAAINNHVSYEALKNC